MNLEAPALKELARYHSEVVMSFANLVKATPMHDIGKISVPDSILQKQDKLTDVLKKPYSW